MAERIEFENSLKRRKEDVRDEKKGIGFPSWGLTGENTNWVIQKPNLFFR